MNKELLEAIGTGLLVAVLIVGIWRGGAFLYEWALKRVRSVTIPPGPNLMP